MAPPTRGESPEPSGGDGSESPRGAASGVRSSAEPATASGAPEHAGALHEVSNALTVILGWIERAREARGAELERALDIAASRARGARVIVRTAIGAAVSADEGAAADGASSQLGGIIDDAVTALEPEARRARVHLRAAVDPGVDRRPVPAGSALNQVLTNLLLNAIAMSPRGGAVQVDASADGDRAVITVADEGPGVPVERRATLFTDGVSTRPGGAGIGLRHSAALAAAAGGALSLAPSDRGARFDVRWPLAGAWPRPSALPPAGPPDAGSPAPLDAEPPSSVAPPRRAPGVSLDGLRILLVEDDDAVVELLDTALTARGATIVSIREAHDLPGALATGPFDAALLDISPIQRDVSGAVSAVRSASPDVHLVVMSGSVVRVPDLEGCGASWVRKPFEVREIVEALGR